MLPRRRPVADASLADTYISLSMRYAAVSIALTLSTSGDSGTFSTCRGGRARAAGLEAIQSFVIADLEASTDDAVDAHDGGRRERLAIGATSFEVEVETVEI